MSFKDKKPNTIPEGYYYNASEMDEYLVIVEPKAEKLDELFPNPHIIEETGGSMCELLIEQAGKLEAVKSWVEYELIEYDKRRLHFAAYKLERDRHDRLIQLDKILEAPDE